MRRKPWGFKAGPCLKVCLFYFKLHISANSILMYQLQKAHYRCSLGI